VSSVNEHVKNVCKVGQRHDCCKYLAADERGLVCLKLDENFGPLVEHKTGMTAQGDNCDGQEGVVA